jgi:metal-responsive CopG/Arc/MetJ family transcriptional regulator
MKRKIKDKKKTISISLEPYLVEIIDDNFYNRSKFFEYCIIQEISKNEQIKKDLKNNNLI